MKEDKKINYKDFKIIYTYLKKHKIKLFIYFILVFLTVIPDALGPFVWGLAL